MGTSDESVENSVFLTIIWLGMTAFIVLHSFLLLRAGAEQTRALFRTTWFVGFGFVVVAIVYFSIYDRSTTAQE